jgi:fructose-1,6-bisphosphatase-3
MLVLIGGFFKAYKLKTGIAGYTLLYNSYGMQLVAYKHVAFRCLSNEGVFP